MFYKDGILFHSTVLDRFRPYGVRHGFACREGGVSTLPHTRSMNISFNLGDSDDTVRHNLDILSRALSEGEYGMEHAVTLSQIHSANVQIIGSENAGEGSVRERGEDGDGFATKTEALIPIIKTADCVPVLLCGLDASDRPVISAVHAGWRGTAAGIAAAAVEKMMSLGASADSIHAAVGAHIGVCCYEVDDDFVEKIRQIRGDRFVERNIDFTSYGKPHANLGKMNRELLISAGVREENIDISPDCTCCNTETYFSHRGMHGKRGTMGAGIVII